MSINRGFDDPRKLGRSSVEALKADKPMDRLLTSHLRAYAEISRDHYTGGFNRIAEVNRAYSRIASRVPFHAEELISEYFNAEVRQSLVNQQSPPESLT